MGLLNSSEIRTFANFLITQTNLTMKNRYECPEAELIPVTVSNFFCSGGQTQVTKSDQGLNSYGAGETWDD